MNFNVPILSNTSLSQKTIVAIEGLNGVGKTTLVEHVGASFPSIKTSQSTPAIYIKNIEIRSYILFSASQMASALYYLSGITDLTSLLKREPSRSILLDRSIWSTLAAAYAKDPQIVPMLFSLLSEMQDYLMIPDYIVVLNASYKTCLERIAKKHSGKEFDKDSEEIFDKKKEFYGILKNAGYPMQFIETDDLDPNEVYYRFQKLDLFDRLMTRI